MSWFKHKEKNDSIQIANEIKKSTDSKTAYAIANKVISTGAGLGMKSAMQQAFIQTAPDSFKNMINNLTKKMKRLPSLDECREHLHKQNSFMSAVQAMDIDLGTIDDILEDAYNKIVNK
jgi:conjugal transfer/entry exclusion protein